LCPNTAETHALASHISDGDAPQQIAATGLIKAVCDPPDWTEMTSRNREVMRWLQAASFLVPLLSSGSIPLQTAALSVTTGFARDAAASQQLVMAGGIPPVLAALRSPTAYIQATAAEITDWIARGEGRQVYFLPHTLQCISWATCGVPCV